MPHPHGNIFYSEPSTLGRKITEILRVVDEIQSHSRSVIEHCYQNFLLESNDADTREYADATDQIREVLIHQHYLSRKDIEICLGFDLTNLAHWPAFDSIRKLHEVLKSEYGSDGERGAVSQPVATVGNGRIAAARSKRVTVSNVSRASLGEWHVTD